MNSILSKSAFPVRTVITDVLILAAVCLIPALSHWVAFPIYKLNPMLFCLLAGMLLVDDRRNALALAVLLPLVSMAVTGMPTPLKALCMVLELTTVVSIFSLLSRRWASFVSLLLAIATGKLVFYALKGLLLAPGLLVTTSLWLQAAVVLLYAAVFALLYKRFTR